MKRHTLFFADPRVLVSAILLTCASPQSVAAAAAQSGACHMGARVVDRSNRKGVVIEAKGSDCRVKLDDGTSRFYLAWMLEDDTPGAKKASSTGGLKAGSYNCVAANGVAGTLKVVIKNMSEYTSSGGKVGKYAYDPATDEVVFESGAWSGFFGKKLGPAKIGISSRRGGFYNTVCDLK